MIELVEDANHSVDEETKISSSSSRKRLLGTLIRDVQAGIADINSILMLAQSGSDKII